MRLTFFTKPDCSLCDAALYVLERVRRDIAFDLERIDISASGNEQWYTCYRDHIPVVHLDGSEFSRHRVDERSLRRALAKG